MCVRPRPHPASVLEQGLPREARATGSRAGQGAGHRGVLAPELTGSVVKWGLADERVDARGSVIVADLQHHGDRIGDSAEVKAVALNREPIIVPAEADMELLDGRISRRGNLHRRRRLD